MHVSWQQQVRDACPLQLQPRCGGSRARRGALEACTRGPANRCRPTRPQPAALDPVRSIIAGEAAGWQAESVRAADGSTTSARTPPRVCVLASKGLIETRQPADGRVPPPPHFDEPEVRAPHDAGRSVAFSSMDLMPVSGVWEGRTAAAQQHETQTRERVKKRKMFERRIPAQFLLFGLGSRLSGFLGPVIIIKHRASEEKTRGCVWVR